MAKQRNLPPNIRANFFIDRELDIELEQYIVRLREKWGRSVSRSRIVREALREYIKRHPA